MFARLRPLGDEQPFAQAEGELRPGALRLQRSFHLGRELRQHRAQEGLHVGVVAAGPALEFHLFVELLLVADGKAVRFERRAPFLHGPGAQMAGIAEALEGVDVIADAAGRHPVVHYTVVPAGSVGDYVNAFERFRDPSHLRAWTMEEWRAALKEHGFTIGHEEQLYKQMEFKNWAGRHDANMQAFLRAMLAQLTPEVKATLEPKGAGPELTFRLCEGLFIAKRA